jgi:hypothetical protein
MRNCQDKENNRKVEKVEEDTRICTRKRAEGMLFSQGGCTQRFNTPPQGLNLTHNLRGNSLSTKIKNHKGEEGEKVL